MNKRCEARAGRSCLMMEAPRWTGMTKGELARNAATRPAVALEVLFHGGDPAGSMPYAVRDQKTDR